MPKNLIASLVTLTIFQMGASPAAAQKGKSQVPTQWEVVDAAGLVVGVAAGLSPGEFAEVMVQDGEDLLHVQVARQAWDIGAGLIWTTADCSGEPYILEDAARFNLTIPASGFYFPFSGLSDRTVWIATSNTLQSVQYVAAGNPKYPPGPPAGCQLVPGGPLTVNAYPARTSTVMGEFQAPFAIRLKR